MRLRGILLLLAAGAALFGGAVEGRVTDGQRPLAGVRVYPDRLRRVYPEPPPLAVTDAEGRWRLELADADEVLAFEKDGWGRDLVPRAEWGRERVLHPAPEFRVERVTVVRLAFPDQPYKVGEADLRHLLFGRQPGAATAANYLYEVSKGSLVLEEGAMLTLEDADHPEPRRDEHRGSITDWVLERLDVKRWDDLDRVDNRSGELRPDGKPDHLWILVPGPPRSVTADPAHLKAVSFLMPLPWNPKKKWSVLFMTEEVPLGNIVHEAFHAMGEHAVDDFYLGCGEGTTAGIWDLMDTGQYRGWDRSHPDKGPWVEDTGYSPSQPMGWTRAELWYRGRFRRTVSELRLQPDRRGALSWEGWIDPLERAPGELPQRVLVPDARKRGRFWELNVRRPWGFDRGRIGNRWGAGMEGLVVARIDPSLLSDEDPRGPVRVVDAHPGTPEPVSPRFPCGRWELDDAAFNLGEGEVQVGSEGPLRWEVLESDAAGRLRVRVERAAPAAKKRAAVRRR